MFFNCDPIPTATPAPTNNPCPNINECTNTCPGERKFDPVRNCKVCDCATTCTPLDETTCGSTSCPNGRKVDANGCKVCDCYVCPDTSTCTNTCPGERKVDYRGCKTCDCQCTTASTCPDLQCQTGFLYDQFGCKKCECKPCPTLTATCAAPCKAANGCPTCECNTANNTCLINCQYYKSDPNTGARICECKCAEISTICTRDCTTYGYARDSSGCEKCECKPPPSTVCTAIACSSNCAVYKLDDKGCKTCTCVTEACDTLTGCNIECKFGRVRNERGCETCVCRTCPTLNCSRICEKGFKRDSTGCEVCDCADTATCTATGTVDATTGTSIDGCNLNCTFGFVIENGCRKCVCRSEEPCKCGDRPTETKPCLDGTRAEYTSTCVASADNKCSYFYRKCPYAIRLVLTKGTFTNDDLKNFLETNRIDIKDVNFEVKAGKDGSQEVTFYVSAESIPEGKRDEDVAKEIASSATANSNNEGYAYVISGETTSTSFGNVVIVSFIGVVLALIM